MPSQAVLDSAPLCTAHDGGLYDLLLDWIPDDSTRQRVLVDNPAKLYGF